MIEWIARQWEFPGLHEWLAYLPIGLWVGFGSSRLTAFVKEKYRLPVGYSRKVFHFLIFTFAGIFGWIGGFPAVQVFGASIGAVVGEAVLNGSRSSLYTALARPSDAPYEKLYIVVPFCMTALGGMLSNLLFNEFALIGYIAAGWGDAVGEPVGTRWGKHRYRVIDITNMKTYRSLEGSMAVLIACWMGCALVLSFGYNYSLVDIVTPSLQIALLTTLVEAVSLHSMDNFTIQLAASGYCYFLLS